MVGVEDRPTAPERAVAAALLVLMAGVTDDSRVEAEGPDPEALW